MGTALAIVGVYALISYSVKCRQREFGIRMALGARPAALLGKAVMRTTLWLVPGVAAGVVLAFAARRALQAELFEVQAWEPGLAVTLGCALLAVRRWRV